MNMLDVEPVAEGLNRFEFTLPSGLVIHFKLLTSKEEKLFLMSKIKLRR